MVISTDSNQCQLIEFFVDGIPAAQGRPRAFKLPTGQIRMYDPKKSRSWKENVAICASIVVGSKLPIEGAIQATLNFYLPWPKSDKKKVKPHTVKPDAENLSKAVCDALEGIGYKNDSQITVLKVTKQYGNRPGVSIKLIQTTNPPQALS
jgi:Holliday junction resolvase RusA-like endonuclease